MTPPQQADSTVPENLLLDVGVAVFDPNVPEDYDEQIEENIAPEVRRAESNYVAYYLKNLLQSTGNWGAVRVVPRSTNAVDLIVSGSILHSDGERPRTGGRRGRRQRAGLVREILQSPGQQVCLRSFGPGEHRSVSGSLSAHRG